MFLSSDPILALGYIEITLRILTAMLIGGALGFNREIRKRPAGLRTHALVTIGAAIITLTVSHHTHEDGFNDDALSRVIQGIFTGIGFLGAGVIWRDASGTQIRGLTSAATIWVSASLGVICGLGYWRFVLLSSLTVLFVLTIGGPIEKFLLNQWQKYNGSDKDEKP